MNDTIINNLNSVAGEDDMLYLLGDVIMGNNIPFHLPKLREKINCKTIHLIYGNHDGKIRRTPELQSLFTSCQDYLEIRIADTLFVLCHYAFGTWNEIGRGAVNLFAHSHNTYTRIHGRQMDVGVDTNDFYPYHIDDIIERMNKIEPAKVDHHTNLTSYS